MKQIEQAHVRRWNRLSVIKVASRLADKYGYDSLTLAMLAKELGIKPPSLYKHVSGLEEVKAGIQAFAAEQLSGALLTASAGRSGDDAIYAVAQAYRKFVKKHPGLQVAMSRPVQKTSDGPAATELSEAYDQLLAVAAGLLGSYGLSEQDTIHALRTLRSLIHGFVMLETTGNFEMPYDLDESYQWAIDAFIAGLRPNTNR